jgi:hypothetical protein
MQNRMGWAPRHPWPPQHSFRLSDPRSGWAEILDYLTCDRSHATSIGTGANCLLAAEANVLGTPVVQFERELPAGHPTAAGHHAETQPLFVMPEVLV